MFRCRLGFHLITHSSAFLPPHPSINVLATARLAMLLVTWSCPVMPTAAGTECIHTNTRATLSTVMMLLLTCDASNVGAKSTVSASRSSSSMSSAAEARRHSVYLQQYSTQYHTAQHDLLWSAQHRERTSARGTVLQPQNAYL